MTLDKILRKINAAIDSSPLIMHTITQPSVKCYKSIRNDCKILDALKLDKYIKDT